MAQESADIDYRIPNLEHCVAEIKADLLLFEETREICTCLLVILDSLQCKKLKGEYYI
jgi:hypothetical protein